MASKIGRHLVSSIRSARNCPALPAALLHHGCNTRRAQPLAELSQAERSEAPPREARQAAEGGQHFDVPELREGRQGKLEATQLPRLGCRELARGG